MSAACGTQASVLSGLAGLFWLDFPFSTELSLGLYLLAPPWPLGPCAGTSSLCDQLSGTTLSFVVFHWGKMALHGLAILVCCFHGALCSLGLFPVAEGVTAPLGALLGYACAVSYHSHKIFMRSKLFFTPEMRKLRPREVNEWNCIIYIRTVQFLK